MKTKILCKTRATHGNLDVLSLSELEPEPSDELLADFDLIIVIDY